MFSPLCCRGLKPALCQEGGQRTSGWPKKCIRDASSRCSEGSLPAPARLRKRKKNNHTSNYKAAKTSPALPKNNRAICSLTTNWYYQRTPLLRALWLEFGHSLGSTGHEPRAREGRRRRHTAAHSKWYKPKETACTTPCKFKPVTQ